MSPKNVILSVIALAALVMASNALFVVNQVQQSIILQFGAPVRVVQEPGLHVKMPFIQETIFYDKRILDLDPPEDEFLLEDKKRINVNAYVRYKITDPLQFYRTLRTEYNLQNTLGKNVNASLRRVLGNVNLVDLLSQERVSIMGEVLDNVRSKAETFGLEIVDVRIGRTDLPPQTSQAVYSRMRTEREREAREARAEGAELAQKIRANADKERTIILAEAKRQSEILRGDGEADRVRILGQAYGKDADFFDFYRTLKEYEDSLLGGNGETKLILNPDSEFFRFFKQN